MRSFFPTRRGFAPLGRWVHRGPAAAGPVAAPPPRCAGSTASRPIGLRPQGASSKPTSPCAIVCPCFDPFTPSSNEPSPPSGSHRSSGKDVVADLHDDAAGPNPRADGFARIPKKGGTVGRIPSVQRVPGRVVRLLGRIASPNETVHDRLEGEGLIRDAADGIGKFRALHPI